MRDSCFEVAARTKGEEIAKRSGELLAARWSGGERFVAEGGGSARGSGCVPSWRSTSRRRLAGVLVECLLACVPQLILGEVGVAA